MAGTEIAIATEDGTAPAWVFGPTDGPAVLMLIDGLGMRPAMRALGERLGAEGFHVLLPDLFYRLGDYTPPEPAALFADPAVRDAWMGKARGAGATPGIMRDARAYLAYFADGAPVATCGYCMGGRLALLLAAAFPARVTAAAAYHPGGLVTDADDSPHRLVGSIRARVYVGAAKDDANFTAEQQRTFDGALATAGVDHRVEQYDARHGWVPSDTPVHDAAATTRHWDTLLALLRGAAFR